MKIFFIITFILLFLSLFLLKYDNKNRNFIFSLIFLINIIYFSNIFLTYILSMLKIKSSYLILSIINILIFILLIYKNYNKKKKITFQKYNISFKEIFSLLIIFFGCIVIGLFRFNKFDSIVYETTDPTVHYKASVYYSHNLMLNNKINSKNELFNNFDRMMPGFYVNCGFFMHLFDNVENYKVYMLFDVFILFLLASTFYITILKIKKVKKNYFISLTIAILYFLAYSLNNFVFGFGYLGVGILSTNLILLIWILIDESDKNINYILLTLFNFGLFFSYYLFVPVLYLGQGLYLIYKWLKKEKIFTQIFKVGLLTLVLPFSLGIIYFILPGFLESGETALSSSISLEGYIYRDFWSNFILIIPLVVYSFILNIKNKKIDSLFFIFVIEILFIGSTFILGVFFNKVSSYYFFKSYYILWIMLYMYIVNLINVNEFNVKCFYKICVYFIVFVILISVSNIETKIQNKNILFNNSIVSPSVANIYWFNAKKIYDKEYILNKNELSLIKNTIKYKEQCLEKNNEIPVIGDYNKKLWFYTLTDVVPVQNHVKNNLIQIYNNKFDLNEFNNNDNVKCFVEFNISNKKDSDEYIEIDYSQYNILYENSGGKLIKK